MALASLKSGYFDPSKGELAKAIKGGFCKVPLPAETDASVVFILDKQQQMRGSSGTAVVISMMLSSWFYRVTLLRNQAVRSTSLNGHQDAWELESIKQLRPPIGAKLLEEGKAAAKKAAAPTPINEPIMPQTSLQADQMRVAPQNQGEIYM